MSTKGAAPAARGDSPGSSRAATDALLGGLAAGRFRPRAWWDFLSAATARSLAQARQRPRAVTGLLVLHGATLVAARGRGRGWTAVSLTLGLTHLGLLEQRRALAGADVVTLVRAQLPVLLAGRPAWAPALALAGDVADGALARRQGTVTPFGGYADSLADAAFWAWWSADDTPPVRLVGLAAWAVPVVAVTGVSVRRGAMVEAPRPRWLRPAGLLQWALTARALHRAVCARRAARSPRRRTPRPGPRDR